MKKREAELSALRELIAAYEAAAMIQGAATESGDYKTGNKASDSLAIIYAEIRRRGVEAQRELLPLLSNADPGVRLWAASHVLDFSSAQAEPVLQALVPVGKFLGLSAQTTLQEWRAGRLKFPG